MGLVDSLVVFVVSWIIGTVGIVAGVRAVLERKTDVGHAAVTALLGAVVWGVVSFLFGWIPLLGILLVLVAWVGVINYRYPGGWKTAAGIGVVAWLVAVVVVWVLSAIGVVAPNVLGIPGV
ncbi:hypothetical protein [Haloarchaeobius sp. TZWSO28]|uniref:hypothetical protein n=1 Tax=Haloarchaeobius sp. TZWSO28 TaxID=3446119 RepID=UPI003EB8E0A3